MPENQFQSPVFKFVGQWLRDNLPQRAGQLLERALPKVSQSEIDRVHERLVREPVQNFKQQMQALTRSHPMVKALRVEDAVWIVEQAANVLHLTASLFNHAEVSAASKGKLGLALVYFVSPFDALPEGLLGPIGYLDDVMLATWVLDSLLNGQNEAEKALIHQLWRGTAEDLERLRGLMRRFDMRKVITLIGRTSTARR